MPDRSRKRDLNQTAYDLVREATGEAPPEAPPAPDPTKDPAAVDLGRLGGLKGGRARADRMTPEARSESARKAAAARWGKKKPGPDPD